MNSKILIGAVILIVVIGAIVLIVNKEGYQAPAAETQSPSNVSSSNEEKTISAEQATVTLSQSGFEPATVTVKAGTRVIWTNSSGKLATVDSAGHPAHLAYPPLNLGEFSDGSQVSVVFDKTGTYKYHNHLSPSQTGTVVVE